MNISELLGKEISSINLGDVVQLKSGGAPLTVTEASPFSLGVRITCVSSGGLLQEIYVMRDALILYTGEPTRAGRYE